MRDGGLFTKQICNVIAGLPHGCTLNEVAEVLGQFCEHQEAEASFVDGVTPLMMACDKNHPACLRFMLMNPLPSQWGSPLDRSFAGSNTALHHAAMSGCVEAIYVLPIMMGKDDGHNIVDLCRERNEHDDTPIMIACVYNQVDFLRQLQTELQEKDFLELLQARNKSEETPMSLALGHGHASIVNFLLGAGVEANYDLVQECKVKMRHMETMLAQASIHPPEYREQQTNVKRCLVTLEVALAKNTRDAMEQLIQSETAEKSRLGTEASHFKTPPAVPKRLPAEGSDIAPNTETRNFENSPWKKAESDLGAAVSISKPLYQTLLDGSVVSSAESESTIVGPSTATSQDTLAKSPNDLLRSRLGNDAAAVMESLCLDASMLLETPHKMAMHMSPSQLQAIENVLNQQLEAVQQAKDIQQRLRSSS